MQKHPKNEIRQARQAVAEILAETLLNMVMAGKVATEPENTDSIFKRNASDPDSMSCH